MTAPVYLDGRFFARHGGRLRFRGFMYGGPVPRDHQQTRVCVPMKPDVAEAR
jgi:hypothetical protein